MYEKCLQYSRALGDFEYKNVEGKGPTEQLVSPEPEFYIKTRDKDTDQFLVLACDGVWDVMTNEDICSFVSDRMRVTDDLEAIANEVIDTCLHKVPTASLHFLFLNTDSFLMVIIFSDFLNDALFFLYVPGKSR